MNYKKIFWGVVLVAIGTLFILKNLGVIWVSWCMIFRLWPLLFIFWGISVIPVKNYVKLILSFLILILGIVIISNSNYRHQRCWNWNIQRDYGNNNKYYYDYNDDEDFEDNEKYYYQNLNEPYDSSTVEAVLKFDAAAGNFEIEDETDMLFDFEKEGNLGNYVVTTKDKNGKKIIKIRLKNSNVEINDNENSAKIKLNTKPVWDFDFNAGAAELNADLSEYKIGKINIDGGASSIDIKLGNKNKLTKLDINAGAASIKIKVPESSGCEVKISTVLSGKDFHGFERIERGLYRTENFQKTTKKIYIEIDAAVSGITVQRY